MTRVVTRDRERPFIMMKGSISHEDITIINIHAPEKAPKYMKQNLIELKGEMENSTIIVGDFSVLLSMDRTTRQKINRKTEDLESIKQTSAERFSQ